MSQPVRLPDSAHQADDTATRPVVVLVPGLGMGGTEMKPLSRYFSRGGFDVRIYHYWPWRRSFEADAERLARCLDELGAERTIAVIAHSLGGLVSLRALTISAPLRPVRLVTLGSPHMSCGIAERLWQWPGFKALLGRGLTTAVASSPVPVPAGVVLGTVAGTLRLGLGSLLRLPPPNDSIIGVDEAHHTGASACVTLPVSHAGMLMSRRVARYARTFVENACFEEATPSPTGSSRDSE